MNKLILFWDEPTITLDYESHECHEYITEIWNKNIIPNKKTKIDNTRVNLFKKFLPFFLLPEKYQIILFSKLPPSKDPIGIKYRNAKIRFNMATLLTIFIII